MDECPQWFSRAQVLALALVPIVFVTPPAFGKDEARQPGTVSGNLKIEVHQDWNYRSDNRNNQTSQTFLKAEPEVELQLTDQFSLYVHGVLTPVRDARSGDDRFFEDHGLYAEQVFLRFVEDDFTVIAGKFTPRFGLAWDEAPGIWGRDVAERHYKFIERIGLGGSYEFDLGEAGTHTVSAGVFFLDTSPVYQSLGRARSPAFRDRSDGGMSNTERLNSFALAYDIENFDVLPGLKFQAAYIDLAHGRDGTADQRGGLLGALYELPISDDLTWVPLIEYALFRNAGGVSGQDRGIGTVSSNLILWEAWNLALAASRVATDVPGSNQARDHQFQATIGYQFAFGLLVEAGWLIEELDDVLTHRLGAMLTYKRKF